MQIEAAVRHSQAETWARGPQRGSGHRLQAAPHLRSPCLKWPSPSSPFGGQLRSVSFPCTPQSAAHKIATVIFSKQVRPCSKQCHCPPPPTLVQPSCPRWLHPTSGAHTCPRPLLSLTVCSASSSLESSPSSGTWQVGAPRSVTAHPFSAFLTHGNYVLL